MHIMQHMCSTCVLIRVFMCSVHVTNMLYVSLEPHCASGQLAVSRGRGGGGGWGGGSGKWNQKVYTAWTQHVGPM